MTGLVLNYLTTLVTFPENTSEESLLILSSQNFNINENTRISKIKILTTRSQQIRYSMNSFRVIYFIKQGAFYECQSIKRDRVNIQHGELKRDHVNKRILHSKSAQAKR